VDGDFFQLFSLTDQSGSFAAVDLPPLNSGLSWDLSQLTADGMIDVIPEPSTWVLLLVGAGALLGLRTGNTIGGRIHRCRSLLP
jgi:hypothetical protein